MSTPLPSLGLVGSSASATSESAPVEVGVVVMVRSRDVCDLLVPISRDEKAGETIEDVCGGVRDRVG